MFDINTVPFSTFGSWLSVSLKGTPGGLTLCSHHNKLNDLFRLTPLIDGEPVNIRHTGRPDGLTLEADTGQIELCFESPGTLRIRGRGLGLAIECLLPTVAYTEGPARVTLNVRKALRRYQVERLSGALELQGAYQGGWKDQATSVVVTPGPDGTFEIAIDEFWSTWEQPKRNTFDHCLTTTRADYEAFLNSMPGAATSHPAARERAAYINWATTVEPCGLLARHTLLMSKNWMCNVWSWDQCFNAMALAAGQPQLALDQMRVLVDHQDRFGCYPDSINDIEKHYNHAKPPIHGWALREIRKRLPEPLDRETLEILYESLSGQALWWLNHRRMTAAALPHYMHGNDSGWDNSTMFDRGVPLRAPDLAAFLVLQSDTLADVAEELGKQGEQKLWEQRRTDLLEALIDQLWQGDHFVARLALDGSVVESQSLISWLPIILGERLPAAMRATLAAGIERHLTEWGLATEHPASPAYEADGYWRGPIWAPATYIAVCGLRASGYPELADTIATRFGKLCAKSGFAENFDALTGAALCDPAYTWTASVFLLLEDRQ